LELVLQGDAVDRGSSVAEPFFFAQVCAIQQDVVRQFAWSDDARVKRLHLGIVSMTTMGFQEVMAAVAECHRAFAAVKRDRSHHPLFAQVAQVGFTLTRQFVPGFAEITFGHDTKGTVASVRLSSPFSSYRCSPSSTTSRSGPRGSSRLSTNGSCGSTSISRASRSRVSGCRSRGSSN